MSEWFYIEFQFNTKCNLSRFQNTGNPVTNSLINNIGFSVKFPLLSKLNMNFE